MNSWLQAYQILKNDDYAHFVSFLSYYYCNKDFHENFLLIFIRTFVKVKFSNIGTFSMFLNKFGISGTIKRSGIQYLHSWEICTFFGTSQNFPPCPYFGGILSQNFIASTAPIHFPFSVLFLQNHLPTHSSGCTLLVLTIFKLVVRF